jgi:hypothetical protein
MWQSPGGSVVFDFRVGPYRAVPKRFLGDFRRYCKLTAIRPTAVWVALRWCMWATGHMPGESSSRAVQLNPEDQRAICIVGQMSKFIEADQKAREED